MKPSRSILDKHFQYVPASNTSVAETWRKHGWKPQEEVRRRLKTTRKNRRPGEHGDDDKGPAFSA